MKCKKRLEETCIFFPNECSGCKNAVDAHKTNFDCIKAMSVKEMAEYIYEHDDNLNDVICKTMYSECPWGDLVSPDNCLCCIKKWLESEVQEDEENIKS